MDSELVL